MDTKTDVVILEADGLIDEQHGYGTPIAGRLKELGFHPTVFAVRENIDNHSVFPSTRQNVLRKESTAERNHPERTSIPTQKSRA